MKRISFRWNEGFLIVFESVEGLVIEGSNSRIALGQRQVTVEGLFEGYREHEESPRAQYKVVYIDLAFPLKGKEVGEGVVYQTSVDTYLGGYGISYTPLEGVAFYLTIYPPSGSLYDHAVISEDRISIYTIKRRHVYLMDEGRRKTLILV
ncbi:MAG: hypothetical protein F7C35_02930 [Desulfurococcales archaeon]|nr:hypothetical protein [Desulfurococcales archaeon]